MQHKTLFTSARSILLATSLLMSISCNLLQTQPQPTTPSMPVSSTASAPGIIKGTLVDGNQRPTQGIILTLGRISGTNCPTEVSGWVQIENPPMEVKTDSTGAFIFDNVPPGCYMLAARLSPTAPSVTLMNEAGDKYFNLTAGQTVNIGNILVKQP